MKWSHLVVLILLYASFSPIHRIAAQESTLELSPMLILDATYSSKDGRILVSYPKKWAQTSNENASSEPGIQFYVANDPDMLKDFGVAAIPSGNVLIAVDVHERYWVHYLDDKLDRSLDVFALRQNLDDAGSDGTDLKPVTINNRPAVETYFKRPNYADGYDLLIDLGDGLLAQVYAYAPLGELGQWDSLVQAIATSITYKPYTKADLTESYASKTFQGEFGLLDVTLLGENVELGIVVAQPEFKGSSLENFISGFAEVWQEDPLMSKDSLKVEKMNVGSHPAQLISVAYTSRPQMRAILEIDLGTGVYASIDTLVDTSRFERWRHIAIAIGEAITYTD